MGLNDLFDEYYEKSLMQGGTTCCPGCGGPLLWRIILETLGSKTNVKLRFDAAHMQAAE